MKVIIELKEEHKSEQKQVNDLLKENEVLKVRVIGMKEKRHLISVLSVYFEDKNLDIPIRNIKYMWVEK